MKNIVLVFTFFASTFGTAFSQPPKAQTLPKSASNQVTKTQTSVPVNTPATTTSNTVNQDRFEYKVKVGVSKDVQKRLADGSVIRQTVKVYNPLAIGFVNNGNKSNPIPKKQRAVLNQETSRVAMGKQTCSTIQNNLSLDNIDNFTVDYANQAAKLYPGALYRADDFLSGNGNDINYGRTPIKLVASVKNIRTPTKEVVNPGQGSIATTVNSFFTSFPTDNARTSSESFQFKVCEVESVAEMAVRVGASGHYFVVSASNMFSTAEKTTHKYLLIDATKEMFTINVESRENGVSLMTDPSKETSDMMYISSVSYGARVLAVVELESTQKEISDKFQGSAEFLVAGGSAEVEGYLKQFNSSMKIYFYGFGGRSIDNRMAYSFNEVKNVCNDMMTNLNYQTAQPIKYQLKGISNEVILSRSATDNYTSQSCTLDRDLQITAKITGIKNIKPDESDTEIYGQVWAQVIDRNGRDIPPVQGKDRLFDLKDFQHLNSDMLRTGFYAPPIEAKFIVPKDQITGAKVIVYYVFLDDDVDPNPDDDLTLAHGTTRKWFKNNITYYVHEFDASQGGIKVGQFMDHDGDSGIEVRTTVSSGPIANK